MLTWVVVGSGPSAQAGLSAAQRDYGFGGAEVVTCNGGYALFEAISPTLYLLADPVAVRRYGDQARALRTARGTRIVSIEGRMPDADEYLRIEPGPASDKYRPGRHPARRLSGLYMLDYALSHGAETVLIVGFDGYRSKGESRVKDYFDGRSGHRNSWRHGVRMSRYLADAARYRPGIRFVLYANPRYRTPPAPNFRLVRT